MAYTFIHALGGSVGKSLLDKSLVDLAKEMFVLAEAKGVTLYLPIDSVIATDYSNDCETDVVEIDQIPDGWMGLDIGPKTQELFIDVINNSKSVLWNGPMGVFEMSNFESGTKSIAHAIAGVTAAGAFSLVGGGDSVAAVNKYGILDQISYVSTGGGALLEYIEGKELPGIKAISG